MSRQGNLLMLPSFNLRQLCYFVTVVEEGQITRAAAKLHIAQPALSQAIGKLETTVGQRLLERDSRGVSLTVSGEQFFERARVAVLAAEETEAIVRPWLRAGPNLVMGLAPNDQVLMRPILRRFAHAHPDVQMRVRYLQPSRRLLDLKEGRIDAEVLYPVSRHQDVVVEPIASATRYVLLADAHPLAKEDTLTFDQIVDETFPGRHASVSQEWAEEVWLTALRGNDPRVTKETPLGCDELWALIFSEKAVAVLPDFLVAATVGDGVRAVRLADTEPMDVGLARRREDRRSSLSLFFEVAHQLPGAQSTQGPNQRPRLRRSPGGEPVVVGSPQ